MPRYNAVLCQDVEELRVYLRPYLNHVLCKFPPQSYLSEQHVMEWLIREEIEVVYGLSCVQHNSRLDPYRKIRNKLRGICPVALEILIPAHVKAPRIFDNPFIQVDIRDEIDLYIQYYRNGMQSDLKC